jgi:CBS domain-containing protein
MFVGEFCSRAVDTIEAVDSVQDAARRMHDRNVGALVVVDGIHRPLGIITDRDIVMRVVAAGLDPYTIRVEQVMSPRVVAVDEQTTLAEAVDTMRTGPFRRLPVVDARHELSGILTLDDLLDATFRMLTSVRELIRQGGPTALARH